MSAFEKAFGVPAGHSLRLVRTALHDELREWEHEEHDGHGKLVAVFESWSRGAASPAGGQGEGCGFVKYSPNGWVLRRSEDDARRRRARPAEEEALPPTIQPPSLRLTTQRPVG